MSLSRDTSHSVMYQRYTTGSGQKYANDAHRLILHRTRLHSRSVRELSYQRKLNCRCAGFLDALLCLSYWSNHPGFRRDTQNPANKCDPRRFPSLLSKYLQLSIQKLNHLTLHKTNYKRAHTLIRKRKLNTFIYSSKPCFRISSNFQKKNIHPSLH